MSELERRTHVWFLLIVLVTLVVYQPAIGGTWIWDDHEVLDANGFIFQPWRYFTMDTFSALTGHGGNLYRPLCYVTYLIDQTILPGPLSAKLGNVAIHLTVLYLIIRIATTLGAPEAWALLGAAVFALHPGSSEPVAFACCRHVTPPTALALAGVLAYLRGRDALAGGLLFLTPFFNEAWVAAPAFLLVWMAANRRIAWSALLGSALGAVAYFAVRAAIGIPLIPPGEGMPTEPLAAIGAMAVRGVALFAIPDTADILPPYVPDPVAGAVVTAIALAACVLVRGRPIVAAFLAPCSVMLPCAIVSANNAITADRYFYVGMASAVGIGGALLGARLFAWVPDRRIAIFALLPLALGFETRARARDWANDVTLFTASLEHGYLRAGFYLGSFWHERNECAAAVPFYRLALRADPRAADNLQACLVDLGEVDEALALAPLVTGPGAWHQVPYLNTARAYLRKENDLERARAYVIRATSRFPDDARGWVMLGNIEGMRGDLDAADRAFTKALAIRPDDAGARAGKAAVERERAVR